MADYYLGALKALERRSKDNVLIFSDVLTERLDALVESMLGQTLSDNDYLKTLELYYKKYRRFENHKGMYFCVLRMQHLLRLKKEVRQQKSLIHLEFSKETDPEVQAFLREHKDYYQDALQEYMRVFLLILLGITVLFLVVSVLCFRLPFLAGWILSVLLYAGLWFFGKNAGLSFLLEKQIQKLYRELDPLCCRLDRSVMQRRAGRKFF